MSAKPSKHDLTRCHACLRPFTEEDQAKRKAVKVERVRATRERSKAAREERRKEERSTEDALFFLKSTGLTLRQSATQLGINLNEAYRLWVRLRRERGIK